MFSGFAVIIGFVGLAIFTVLVVIFIIRSAIKDANSGFGRDRPRDESSSKE